MNSGGSNNRGSSSSSAKEDDHPKQVDMFTMNPGSSGVLIAETKANTNSIRAADLLSSMHRRMETAEQGRQRRLLLNDFNSSSSASQIATQQQQQQQQQQQKLLTYSGPCLSCLMRALQSSGLLNSCWSAAFTELEEAFAIKRIADSMTGEDVGGGGGGVAGASEGLRSSQQHPQSPLFRQQQKLPGQQFGMEAAPIRWQHQQQLPAVRQAATTGPGLTKWHALESLCSLMSDIGACQHRAGGGGY